MGGNALQVPVRRISATEMTRISTHLNAVLRKELGVDVRFIPAYRSKPDFGDIDVIVERDKQLCEDGFVRFIHEDLMEIARTFFNAREFAPNTSMLSFDYRDRVTDLEGVQVDLLLTPSAHLQTSVDYYSYNDLGNFIGRIAHKMGLKFGHEGLMYLHREDDHLFRTLPVSSDLSRTLECLGFDPQRYARGFDTLEDIFAFAASSRYFHRDLFLLENRNHKARTRDRKRANYNSFLNYIATHDLPQYSYPVDQNKEEWLPHIFKHFPAFEQDLLLSRNDWDKQRKFKQVFNGKNVGAYTGLQGKELGAFMTAFREHLSSEELLALVHQEDYQELEQRARGFLPEFQRSHKAFKI